MIDTLDEIKLHLDSSVEWDIGREHDMNFTLVYKGPLPTNARAPEKQRIRQQFHPQLKEFWANRLAHRVSRAGITMQDMPLGTPVARDHVDTIAKNYAVGEYGFVPLVTETSALACRLDIFFLSKGLHQRIIANADLDNRLKSLFDGLRRPDRLEELGGWTPSEDEKPFYCLLSNDSLITDIRITGETLLDPSITDPNHYHLFVRVKTRPLRLTLVNADML
jgi:hypothetical protein